MFTILWPHPNFWAAVFKGRLHSQITWNNCKNVNYLHRRKQVALCSSFHNKCTQNVVSSVYTRCYKLVLSSFVIGQTGLRAVPVPL
jgi:hypothetical protein